MYKNKTPMLQKVLEIDCRLPVFTSNKDKKLEYEDILAYK